jgi:hypothetical protein
MEMKLLYRFPIMKNIQGKKIKKLINPIK